jgi:tripartite-type tricarboxylate transporter receptor subunit TctC
MALIGATAAPFQDVRGLLAHARANPGKVNFGTTTAFNSAALAELARLGGVSIEEVPYRGGGPMLNDLVAGHLLAGFSSPQTVVPHLASGRMRILGITSTTRSSLLPGVPTIAEAGVPGYEFAAWTALLGPAGMPPALARRLHEAVAEACADPAVRARLNSLGADGEVAGPGRLAQVMAEDDVRWAAAAARGMVLRPG